MGLCMLYFICWRHGCHQAFVDEIAAMLGVTQVIGNSHKRQLAEIVMPPEIAGSGDIARPWEGHGFSRAVSGEKPAALAAEVSNFVPLTALTAQDRKPIFVSDIFAHTELLAAPVFDATVAMVPPVTTRCPVSTVLD